MHAGCVVENGMVIILLESETTEQLIFHFLHMPFAIYNIIGPSSSLEFSL